MIDTSLKFGAPGQWLERAGTVDEFLKGASLGLQAQRQRNEQEMAGQRLALAREAQATNQALANLQIQRMKDDLEEREPSMNYIREIDKGNYNAVKPNVSPRSALLLDQYRLQAQAQDTAFQMQKTIAQDGMDFVNTIRQLGPEERSGVVMGLKNLNEWPPQRGWVPSPEARQVLSAYLKANQKRTNEEAMAKATAVEQGRYEGRYNALGTLDENDENVYDPNNPEKVIAVKELQPNGTYKYITVQEKRLKEIDSRRIALVERGKSIDSDLRDIRADLKDMETTDEEAKILKQKKAKKAAEKDALEEELKKLDDEATNLHGSSPAKTTPAPTAAPAPKVGSYDDFQNWFKSKQAQ